MEAISHFSLEPHHGPYESWPLTSRLRVDGEPTAQRVPGYVIDAQYQSESGVLLITSHDCPFEEASHLLLLDSHHGIVAGKVLQRPYSSFLLYAHWPLDAHALVLHYHNALFFTLQVLPPGFLRRRPRLLLRRCRHWHSDADMLRSYQRLQADLATAAPDKRREP